MPRSPKFLTPLSPPPADTVTARLIVRRVKDARYPDALFPVWRYHPFFTDSTEPVADADITHRRHAIIETVFADLIDGPLAHMPSGRFGANSAWILCAAIAHNLLRAAATLSRPAARRRARGHPAPQDRQHPRPPGPPTTTTHPAPTQPLALGRRMASTVAQHHRQPPTPASHTSLTTAQRPNRSTQEKLGRPADTSRPHTNTRDHNRPTHQSSIHRWIEAKRRAPRSIGRYATSHVSGSRADRAHQFAAV